MTNWCSNRMALRGPEYELDRFKRTCIRPPRGETEISLDFEALIPMPPSIVATLYDRSRQLEQTALLSTGYSGWYDWQDAHWGVPRNAAVFHELLNQPDCYDCRFETAWHPPQQFLGALATRFPSITAQIFSVEEGCDAAWLSLVQGGSFRSTATDVTPDLQFLVYDAAPGLCGPASDLELQKYIATVMAIRTPLRNAEKLLASTQVEAAWHSMHKHLSSSEIARLRFARDVLGFLEWLDWQEDCSPELLDTHKALGRHVSEPRNLTFLLAQKVVTPLEQTVMNYVALALQAGCQTSRECEQVLTSALGVALREHSEDELFEWAGVAMCRGVHVDASTAETLRTSVLEAARTVLSAAEQHIEELASAANPQVPA
jgi:hypothetical protein